MNNRQAERNLTVDDILNDNFSDKRNKMQIDSYSETKPNSTIDILNNNNVNFIDKVTGVNGNLKRKIAFDGNSNFKLNKMVAPEINITIGKDPDKTIRLELRNMNDSKEFDEFAQEEKEGDSELTGPGSDSNTNGINNVHEEFDIGDNETTDSVSDFTINLCGVLHLTYLQFIFINSKEM